MIYAWLLLTAVCALAAFVLAFRATHQVLRRSLAMAASLAVVSSLCLFVYLPFLPSLSSQLSFGSRIDIVVPWIRAGLCLSLVSVLMSVFAIPKSRILLLISSFSIFALWYLAGVSAV